MSVVLGQAECMQTLIPSTSDDVSLLCQCVCEMVTSKLNSKGGSPYASDAACTNKDDSLGAGCLLHSASLQQQHVFHALFV